jgi:5-methylthioribose kinase
LLSKSHHVVTRRREFLAAAITFWQSYRAEVGETDWTADLEQHAIRHTLGCLLARTSGRSPLEYLSADERNRQRQATLALMTDPPATMNEFVEQFLRSLES